MPWDISTGPRRRTVRPASGDRSRPTPSATGRFARTLDEAERGLAAAQRKIVQIEQARRDLAAANARLVELTGILAELDAETAAA